MIWDRYITCFFNLVFLFVNGMKCRGFLFSSNAVHKRNNFIRAISSKISSSEMLEVPHIVSHDFLHLKNSTTYPTLDCLTVLDAMCVIVKSPSPIEYEFSCEKTYTHEEHDVNSEEVQYGKLKEQTNKSRWNKFIGGRIALRRALRLLKSADAPSILGDSWGAPTLPLDIAGSISHKDDVAVGVARRDIEGRIGVDLEHTNNKAASTLWRRILTPAEQSRLGKLKDISIEEEVLLRFSFKESVYKALHPFVARSVDFSEVEIDPLEGGSATINFLLKSDESSKLEGRAYWQRYRQKYWLTCVYIRDASKTISKYR